jgi:two-component system nitrate/nitrite response regulator NarL
MKLLIVDDHPVLREGLAALLVQAVPNITVLLARDGAEGLEMAAAHPDLDAVLLDIAMPGMSGMEVLAEFGRRHPALPVAVLSSSEDPQDVRRALGAGALGYIPKSANRQTILSALQLVLQGEVYVPPLLLQAIGFLPRPVYAGLAIKSAIGQLTARQADVLKLLAQGLSNKATGEALGLSEKTVKAHVTAIFKALNVINRTQAAAVGRDLGLI